MPEAAMYQQLASLLRDQIRSGQLRPLQHLPSETALMQEHGLARDTVRRAIAVLRAEGLIVVEPGRGTWVRMESERQVVRPPRGSRTLVRIPTPEEALEFDLPQGVPAVVVSFGGRETLYRYDAVELHHN
jgi:DNA-binding FadR family transcriptional regulator